MTFTKLKSSSFIKYLCIFQLYMLVETTTPIWAAYKCLTAEGELIFSQLPCPDGAESEALDLGLYSANTLSSKESQKSTTTSNIANNEIAGLSNSAAFNTYVKVKLRFPEKGNDYENVMVHTLGGAGSNRRSYLLSRGETTVQLEGSATSSYHLRGDQLLKKYPELQSDINKLKSDERMIGIQYRCTLYMKTPNLDGEPPWIYFNMGEKASIISAYQRKPGEVHINFNHPVIDALGISTSIKIVRTIPPGSSALDDYIILPTLSKRTPERYVHVRSLDKSSLRPLKASDIEEICGNRVKFH
ncbi:hypothetical protein [Candidatus Venteria ishoeyi]|uniref:DUF4124 domain-containing protein n=1 Tax=Candidatus Venteria ishoeyi TaxID=1899563 RepID=A0A1H6FE87_9GAMM|nr:hypothetical protein [Candidatus Venteria ishoeyi]SEH08388.1 Uncharacterised protein [Candidatus Venteria ishoeyi]